MKSREDCPLLQKLLFKQMRDKRQNMIAIWLLRNVGNPKEMKSTLLEKHMWKEAKMEVDSSEINDAKKMIGNIIHNDGFKKSEGSEAWAKGCKKKRDKQSRKTKVPVERQSKESLQQLVDAIKKKCGGKPE